ncbi:MAG: RidA family protein [Candidatus Symbiothrix sp.]|nr:RidA family protein [Candidatus Symbiothrix sp.]
MKQAILSTNAPAAIGPYSQAIKTGNVVYCSGQLGLDPATGNLADGVVAQTEQAFKNIRAVLAAAGLTVDNVIKTTVFLADMADFTTVNEIYGNHFREPYPARSAVAVRTLPKNGLVEIEVIAAL